MLPSFAETLEFFVHTLDAMSMIFKAFGLNMSWINTKIQKIFTFFDRVLDFPAPLNVLDVLLVA